MKATPVRKPAAPGLSNEEVEAIVGEIADYRLTLDELEGEQKASLNALNAAILKLRQDEEAAMERQSTVMRQLNVSLDERVQVLRGWAEAHKGEHFAGKKRSLELIHGTVGFKLSKPRVEALPRRSLARAAAWLAGLTWGKKYVRFTAPALDLQKILNDRAKLEAKPERLHRIMGIRIVQDDEFYVRCHATRSDLLNAKATAPEQKEAA